MSVTTDLRTYHGIHRRLFIAIDGLEPFFFQRGNQETPTWSRSVKVALQAPEEFSMELDLGEMAPSLSAITFNLDDIDDTDGKSFFGKLFGSVAWQYSKHTRVSESTSYNTYIDSDATTIPVKTTADFPSEGTIYIGQETITHTSKDSTNFLNCSKGRYPCVIDGSDFGKTYQRPLEKTKGTLIAVGEVPFTFIGRRVSLYVTTYDKANNQWQPEADSKLLWVGNISDQISQDGTTGKWQLSCTSILQQLEDKSIASNLGETSLSGINISSNTNNIGNKFKIYEYDRSKIAATTEITVTAGHYKNPDELAKEITTQIKNATWVNANGTHVGDIFVERNKTGKYQFRYYYACYADLYYVRKYVIVAHHNYASAGSKKEYIYCHALQALGFDSTESNPEFTTERDQINRTYVGTLEADEKAFVAYHPLDRRCNGNKLYCKEPRNLYPSQGDYGSTRANVSVEDAMIEPYSELEANYYVSYSGWFVGASEQWLTLDGPSITTLKNPNAYTGQTGGDEVRKVKNAYIPFWRDNNYLSRGPFELLLYPLLSTGTAGYNHTTYDTMPYDLSCGVQSDLVDVDSFLKADQELGNSILAQRRMYVIDESTTWAELAQLEGKLFGYAPVWRNGKITIRPILHNPNYNDWTVHLDDSSRATPNDFPTLTMSTGTVVNQYEVKGDYNYTKSEFPPPTIITDIDSKDGISVIKKISIEHKGIHSTKKQSLKGVLTNQLIERWIRFPMPVIETSLNPVYLNRVFVGDIVKFTSDLIMAQDGTGDRGITSYAIVTGVSWNYTTFTGNVTLLLISDRGIGAPWSPSALVTSISVPNDQLTLSADYWNDVANIKDGDSIGDQGWKINLIERWNEDSNHLKYGPFIIDSDFETDGLNILTLQSGSLASVDTSKEYIITFADYGDCVSSQIIGDGLELKGIWQADTTTEQLDGNEYPQVWG